MLELLMDGQAMDLAADATLPLTLTNPHLTYDSRAGQVIPLPKLPLSPRNSRFLGYYEQPQRGNILQRRTAALQYGGRLVQEGLYLLTEAGPDGYAGTLVEPLGEFFGEWANRPLPTLDLGTIALPGSGLPNTGLIVGGGRTMLAFPTVTNADYYEANGASVSYTGKVNDYVSGAYTSAGPKVPFLFLPELFYRLGVLTGTTITGDFLTHTTYQHLLVYNTQATDGSLTVTINRHLPDLTPAQLLYELRKWFNLKLDFDALGKTLRIGFWDTAVAQPATKDWSDKLVAGTFKKTPEINTRLRLTSTLDATDALTKDTTLLGTVLADHVTAPTVENSGGVAPITTAFSTIPLATDLITVRQPGRTTVLGQINKTFGPRLTFWRGVVSALPRCGPIRDDHSLFWTGTTGLAAQQWVNTEAMRAEQFYATAQVLLDETDLATLDFASKVHLMGIDYFVYSVEVTLPITAPATTLLVAA